MEPLDENVEEEIEMGITFPRYERNSHEFRMVEEMFEENDSETWERAEKFKQKHKERVKTEMIETEPSYYNQGNYLSHPPEGGKIGIEYEDDHFAHLSNPESDDEMEKSSENFRKTEETLKLIAQQKNAAEPKYTGIIENPPTAIVESGKTECPSGAPQETDENALR
ncbi:hypothetical protein JTB14_021439 [Gonioctena quinquepunctata]|nr:hypothetical protein JTB14_021439 [Gonioctena quinquepunctata]